MGSLFAEINLTSMLIALSFLGVLSVIQLVDHVEYNSAFGLSNENLIIPVASDSEFLTYDDLITGFSMKYPSDWDRSQHLDKSVTFVAPREIDSEINPAGIAVMVKDIESNTTMRSITQTQLDTLENLYPDIQILESIQTSFLGNPAHMIIFTATDNTENLRKAMQIWFKEDTKAYLITYKSDNDNFSKYLPTVDKMLNSFYTYKK
ncbi:MAG TPA: PsbP-related protein [Nitrososphaeraceae archaeon]